MKALMTSTLANKYETQRGRERIKELESKKKTKSLRKTNDDPPKVGKDQIERFGLGY